MTTRLVRALLATLATLVLVSVFSSAQVLKGSREYSPQWGGFRAETLNKELKLTPQQQTQVRPIVESEQSQFAQIRDSAGQKIHALLSPGQQKRFNIGGPWVRGGRITPAYSPQWGGFILQHLTQELNLGTDQQAAIKPILTQAQAEFQGAHQKAGEQIAAVLKGDQQKKFQAISRSEKP